MYLNNRRSFLKKITALLGALSIGKIPLKSFPARISMPWSYAMCNESMQGRDWHEQCKVISDAGYKSVEIAPFTLVENSVEEISQSERQQLVETMQKYELHCVGLHWLLTPPPEDLHFTTPDEKIRNRTIDYLDALIDFCADLGGEVMIFGSPGQRSTTQGASVEEAKTNLADGLSKVADHAEERNIKILLEPLDRSQSDVVNTIAEAVEIIEKVDHPAVQTMFDFHNTPDETEPFHVLLEKYFDHIYHIHIQEMDGSYLGTGNAVNDYVKALQTLKDLEYDKYISLEVFDFSPGGETIASESMVTLKEIEEKLN